MLIPEYQKIMNNLHRISFNGMEFYYSYKTLVGFRDNQEILISQNEWGSTSGLHLNNITALCNAHLVERIPHKELMNRVNGIIEFVLDGNKR